MFQEYRVIKLKRVLDLGDLLMYKVFFDDEVTLIVDQKRFIGLSLFKTLNIQRRVEISLTSMIF